MVVLHLGRHERNKGVFKDVSNEGIHSSWDKSPLGFLWATHTNPISIYFFVFFFYLFRKIREQLNSNFLDLPVLLLFRCFQCTAGCKHQLALEVSSLSSLLLAVQRKILSYASTSF